MGLFQKVFGKKPQSGEQGHYSQYIPLNGYDARFVPFSGNAWDNEIVRAAVDSFARRAAIVMPRHIRRENGKEIEVNDSLNRILQYMPNPYSTAYKFYYRMAANYKIFNGAFVYPVWEPKLGGGWRLRALYNINCSDTELIDYMGELYIKFRFSSGNTYTVPFSEMIFVGSHFLDNDIFGSQNRPIVSTLQTAEAFNRSMTKFADLVVSVRGILQVNGAPKREDLIKRRDEFIADNLRLKTNGSGIVVTDNKLTYTPLKEAIAAIPDKQLQYTKEGIYDYYGTNTKIVQNSGNRDDETAFYNGELKPFFVQVSQAFTNCMFTEKERGFNNEIVANISTLSYEKTEVKLQAVKFLSEIGGLTLDQALTTLGYPPIGGEEGNRRVQTLNVVNAEKADKYQLNESDREPDGKEGEKPKETTPEEGEGEED